MNEFKNIAGIIMAAGRGRRMKANVPKPFINLNGNPIIWYSFNLLKQLNIENRFVVIPEKNNEYFIESISKIDPQAKCITDKTEARGNASSLFSSLIHIPNDIDQLIIIHPDSSCFLSENTLLPAIKNHLDKKLLATFSIKERDFLEAKKAKNNQEFEPKTSGIFIFKKTWLDQITPDVTIDPMTREYRLEYLFEHVNQQPDKISLFYIPSSEYKNINAIEDINNNK